MLEDIKMNWLGIDEQPPAPPTVTFEERQEEWQRTHYPRLWEAFEMENIESVIEEHKVALDILWGLQWKGHFDYIPEIIEKGRMLWRLREKHESEKQPDI